MITLYYGNLAPREVEGATGMYSVIFVRSSPLFFFSLFLLRCCLFFAEISNNAGRNSGVNRSCPVYDLFSTQFIISSSHSSFFHYVQYNNRLGWAGRNRTRTDGAGTRDGTGGQAGGQRRGEQGTETGGWPEKRRGGFRRAGGGAMRRTSKLVRAEAGQYCCCPSSSLASRYVK